MYLILPNEDKTTSVMESDIVRTVPLSMGLGDGDGDGDGEMVTMLVMVTW